MKTGQYLYIARNKIYISPIPAYNTHIYDGGTITIPVKLDNLTTGYIYIWQYVIVKITVQAFVMVPICTHANNVFLRNQCLWETFFLDFDFFSKKVVKRL